MKIYIFIMIAALPFNYLLCQKKTNTKKTNVECNGTYWLNKNTDFTDRDSVRILGSVKRIHQNLEADPYSYIIINNKKYNADREGNFDFKIKPGKYFIFAKGAYTFGINTNLIQFYVGVSYDFTFYLKGLPPIAD